MSTLLIVILAGVGALVGGFVIGTLLGKRAAGSHLIDSKRLGESIISDAQKNAKNYRKEADIEAKDNNLKMKLEFEQTTRDTREPARLFGVAVDATPDESRNTLRLRALRARFHRFDGGALDRRAHGGGDFDHPRSEPRDRRMERQCDGRTSL